MAHDVNQSETDVAAQVRSALVETISSERYDLWIPENTQWIWNAGKLHLHFPSEFSCQLAKRMLARDIAQVLQQTWGENADVEYHVSQTRAAAAKQAATKQAHVDGQAKLAPTGAAADREMPVAQRVSRLTAPQPCAAPQPVRGPTNPPDLWQQFVHGSSNQLAWTTANVILSEPGKLTPVILYGPSGCGKTMLVSAIAERLRNSRRMRRVVHMSSEQFTNDFMEGLRGGGLPIFRRKYRDVEALIVEDIQFFVNKKSTIGEFKHTLDNLLRLGKQVILTADRSLNELQGLGSELVGRLRGGMVTPLYPLDAFLRVQVLSAHLDSAGIVLAPEITEQIAAKTTGDGRVLSGIAKRLIAFSSIQSRPSSHSRQLSWEDCWTAVYDLVQATQPIVRIADIERIVCNMFGLEPTSLQSSSKTRTVSQPRMLAMFLARKYTPAAYKEIGDYFGHRRHSTVISAEKTVEKWLNKNNDLHVGRGLAVRDAIRHVESQLQIG